MLSIIQVCLLCCLREQQQQGADGEFYYCTDGLVFCVHSSAVKLSFDHVRQCCKQTINKVFTITEKASTRAFYWLEAPTSTFTFKLFKSRHYAKRAPKHS